jgi:cysteinyl-tRNA synthetase
MNIYDTLSKETKTLDKKKIIKWYMCGPTVYDHAHLGHARNYITNDILIRILTHLGYQTCLTMNITDVDDKIIKKTLETYQNPNEWKKISEQYESSFLEDMMQLNVKMPDMLTRVSDYIPEIIAFIETLITKGYAYKSEQSASVYFDSQNYYKDFTDGFDVPATDFEEEVSDAKFLNEKKNICDFALWKAIKTVKTNTGEYLEPYWDSPWGRGRPGWHIECSAMSHTVFGEDLTIHSGGVDLKFPHHENERKQCIGMTGNEKWVELFIHIGHLHIDGLKMSKSLKNFITIKNIQEKYNANVLRMFCLMHKYSDNIDFNEKHMDQVALIVKQIESFLSRTEHFVKDETNKLKYTKPTQQNINTILHITTIKREIELDLQNDFDTPSVIKKMMHLIDIANLNNNDYSISSLIFNYIVDMTNMFGMKLERKSNSNNNNEIKLVKVIENFRNNVRDYAKINKSNELFKISDLVRDDLANNFGINLIDDKNKKIEKKKC